MCFLFGVEFESMANIAPQICLPSDPPSTKIASDNPTAKRTRFGQDDSSMFWMYSILTYLKTSPGLIAFLYQEWNFAV